MVSSDYCGEGEFYEEFSLRTTQSNGFRVMMGICEQRNIDTISIVLFWAYLSLLLPLCFCR